MALGPQHQRQPFGRVRDELVEVIESSDSARAAVTNPASRSTENPAVQGSIRVHGTWNTVPIDTRTTPVERVGAARGDEHRIDPQGCR